MLNVVIACQRGKGYLEIFAKEECFRAKSLKARDVIDTARIYALSKFA